MNAKERALEDFRGFYRKKRGEMGGVTDMYLSRDTEPTQISKLSTNDHYLPPSRVVPRFTINSGNGNSEKKLARQRETT